MLGRAHIPWHISWLQRALILLAGAVLPIAAAQAAPPVSVSDGWFRYITPQTPAGGYMRLHDRSGHGAVLVGMSSPGCGMLMMHRTESANGADRMVMVPKVPIPPGGSVAFAPGGYHLMCMRPHMRTGEKLPVTLSFQGGQQMTAPFTVYGAAGKPSEQ